MFSDDLIIYLHWIEAAAAAPLTSPDTPRGNGNSSALAHNLPLPPAKALYRSLSVVSLLSPAQQVNNAGP